MQIIGTKIFESSIRRKLRYFYFDHIRPIFCDMNKNIRGQIPRTFAETDDMFRDISFALIKDFYEEQYSCDNVDWFADEKHRKVAAWLEESYKYIVELRPILIKQYESILFTEDYHKVENHERLITIADTVVLHGLVSYREYLWT